MKILLIEDHHVGKKIQSDEGKKNSHLVLIDFFRINNNRRTIFEKGEIHQRAMKYFDVPMLKEYTSLSFNPFSSSKR